MGNSRHEASQHNVACGRRIWESLGVSLSAFAGLCLCVPSGGALRGVEFSVISTPLPRKTDAWIEKEVLRVPA